MKYSLDDKRVTLVGSGHYIAPNATLIGDVTLQENASVWFNCVLRGDADHIEIGAGSNIQDGSVLHVDPGFPLTVGANVTVGHKAMLHGCTIGDGSLVLGSPGKIKSQLSAEQQQALLRSASHYVLNGKRYNSQLKEQE